MDAPPSGVDVEDRGGGGDRDWVELLVARNDIDAQLLVGRLTESGIESRTVKDRGAPGAWLYGGINPWAPVRVYVRRFQLTDARMVLAELSYHFTPSADRRSRRPSGSRWRVRPIWWATALLLGLFLAVLALAQAGQAMGFCQLPVFCAGDQATEQPPVTP